MATLQNESFEGAGASAGLAASWTAARDNGSQSIGLFSSDGKPFENFEAEWSTNETAQTSFAPGDIESTTFEGGVATVDSFDASWKAPILEGTVQVASTAGLAAGEVVESVSTGARSVIKALEAGPVIRLINVNFGGAGLPLLESGETIKRRSPQTQSLGTGNGTAYGFDGTLSTLTVWANSIVITALANDGTKLRITDNGSGKLIGDIDDVDGTNTINYTTGAISARFKSPAKSGSAVHVEWDAADFSTTTTGAFIKSNQPPYTFQALEAFSDDVLLVGLKDDFEAAWDDNETSETAYTDAPTPGGATKATGIQDNFETGWDSNQNAQTAFDPGDLTQGTFVDGSAEDFELSWTTTMQY